MIKGFNKVFVGSTEVAKIYLGSSLLFSNLIIANIETTNVINYGISQGYTISSKEYLQKLDNYITDLKTYNLWDKFDLHYWFVGDGDLNFKCINIINPNQFSGTPYGGLVNNLTNIWGNLVDGYIDTHFNLLNANNKYALNDAHRSAYVVVSESYIVNYAIIDGVNHIFYPNSFRAHEYHGNGINGSVYGDSPNLKGMGYKSINRIVDNNILLYNNSTEIQREGEDAFFIDVTQLVFRERGFYGNIFLATYSLGSNIISQDAINHQTAIQNNL